MLTDGVFCPIPWTGFMYNFNGTVKNCIRSSHQLPTIGNLCNNTIEEILHGKENLKVQQSILESKKVPSCHTCYDLECGKTGFDIISDRIFYIRELRKQPLDTYQTGNFNLKTIDIRWSNTCNFACTYCSPEFSSKWSKELHVQHITPSEERLSGLKQYVFDRAEQLEHVYMAGGEPLLMKQNLELLNLLKKVNPNVHLRINTNLSKTGTRVFERACEFENVHWTVSGETMGDQFNYIRYGGKWEDWLENLDIITKLGHKVSFNMLYYMLNYDSLFNTIDFLLSKGYHPNSFVAGALLSPEYLNIRHLPKDALRYVKATLQDRIDQKPGYLLEDSYRNLLHYVEQPFEANFEGALKQLQEVDKRRGIDSKTVFPEVYKLL
jgi:MoaA/NifB/PqqE/SkfB family radical SAM enzyme